MRITFIILVILTALQFLGVVSTAYLTSDILGALYESRYGIVLVLILWSIFIIYKKYKSK
jgi:hypothetical protein